MELKKIKSINVYYLSANTIEVGDLLIVGSLQQILNYVQTSLIVNPFDIPSVTYIDSEGQSVTVKIQSSLVATDFQVGVPFEYKGINGVVTDERGWYVIELVENSLYQFILTSDVGTTYLPKNPIWKGSLPDLLGFIFNKLS